MSIAQLSGVTIKFNPASREVTIDSPPGINCDDLRTVVDDRIRLIGADLSQRLNAAFSLRGPIENMTAEKMVQIMKTFKNVILTRSERIDRRSEVKANLHLASPFANGKMSKLSIEEIKDVVSETNALFYKIENCYQEAKDRFKVAQNETGLEIKILIEKVVEIG